MKLQYSATTSIGITWIDCQDRFDEFVDEAAKFHGHTRDQIINDGLLKGMTVPSTGCKIRDADSLKKTADQITRDAEEILRKSRENDGYDFEDGE